MKFRRSGLARTCRGRSRFGDQARSMRFQQQEHPGSNGNTAGGPTGSVVFGAEQWPGLHQPDQPVRELVVAAVARADPRAAPPRRARRQEQLRGVAAPEGDAGASPTVASPGSGKTFTVTYHLNPAAKWSRTARRSRRPTWCSAGTPRSTPRAASRRPVTTRSRASRRPIRRPRSCTSRRPTTTGPTSWAASRA